MAGTLAWSSGCGPRPWPDRSSLLLTLLMATLLSILPHSSHSGTLLQTAAAATGAAGLDTDPTPALVAHFQRITSRTAWRHEFVLPEDLLARAYVMTGDDSRTRAFVRKLVLGRPVQYAHLGGSVSVFALAKRKDFNWHAMFHRWLQLAFSPCGDELPHLTARDPLETYGEHLQVCGSNTVELVNHAIGATSCIFAEKCVVQRVNATHTDWVLIEYTVNAMHGTGGESLGTAERMALERLLRKLLLLPSQPGVALLHSFAAGESEAHEGHHYGPMIEDWHNLLLSYYGNIQAISVRSAVYDLVRRVDWKHLQPPMYMPDGLHPEWWGHLVWADVMIYTFKRLAREVMAEELLREAVPEALLLPGRPGERPSAARRAQEQAEDWDEEAQRERQSQDIAQAARGAGGETPAGKQRGPERGTAATAGLASAARRVQRERQASPERDGLCVAVPQALQDYFLEVTARSLAKELLLAGGPSVGGGAAGPGSGGGAPGGGGGGGGAGEAAPEGSQAGGAVPLGVPLLPPPLVPGNWEHSDGFCYLSEAFLPLVAAHEGWKWEDEGKPGRPKWGFVSAVPGSRLHIEVDTTVGGLLGALDGPMGAGAGAGQAAASGSKVETIGGFAAVNQTHAQVMLGYLATYEKIGSARVSCTSGCSCEESTLDGRLGQRYSTTKFLTMMVSAHPRCRITIEVLDTKFKVNGLILNSKPYFWDAEAMASHYDLMITDLLNTMN